MGVTIKRQPTYEPRAVLHWYDFLCPFCYIAQDRNAILRRRGLDVIELPFEAHPDIPPDGIMSGSRKGAMYSMLEREARNAGLALRWPPRLPNTRQALAAAEWARRYQPREFPELHRSLFDAHFALGEDLADQGVIDRHAVASGIDLTALHAALNDGSAAGFVTEAEEIGRQYGVRGTPAWLLNEQLISGLLPAQDFEKLLQEVPETLR
jgi:predicted DsbA family dithiol-disulfide isomerase